MSHLDTMRRLGRTITYNTGVSRRLDSITAAILLSHLVWSSSPTGSGWTQCPPDAAGWFRYPLADLGRDIDLGRKAVLNARATLEARGVVETEQRGLPAVLFWRVVPEGFEALLSDIPKRDDQNAPPPVVPKGDDTGSPKGTTVDAERCTHTSSQSSKAEDKSRPVPLLLEPSEPPGATKPPLVTVRPESLVAGAHDGVRLTRDLSGPSFAVADGLLALWAKTWGKTRVAFTAERKKTWARWVAEGRTPSEMAKAIIGMTHDASPADRAVHNDWPLVARNFDTFVGLWESKAAKGLAPAWPKTSTSSVPGCRLWKGIWIPVGHQPDQLDEDRVTEGRQVFIVDDRNWADPAYDPSRRIAKQTAKYGPINKPGGR